MSNRVTVAVAALLLVSMLLTGCDKNPASGSTASQSSSDAQSSSVSSDVSSQNVGVGFVYGKVDPSSVPVTPADEEAGSKTYEVTPELRGEMFDYFSQYYTLIMPQADFDKPENLDINYMVMLGVAVTKPFNIVVSPYASNYSYAIADVQTSLQKYLGTQLTDGQNFKMYDYDMERGIIYSFSYKPLYTNFYRLISLSKDENNLYTAKFDIYQNIITTEEGYNNALPSIREQIVSGNFTDEFTHTGTCTLTYTRMVDSDGQTFLRYNSLKSDLI